MSTADININKPHTKKRVLVAPLDWGLGHATRCIPVIRVLLMQPDCEVIIAAEKSGAALLKKEFPESETLPLAGYNISYSKSRAFFFLKMMMQFPKVKRAIRREHEWLDGIIKEHRIDMVISDNRYGLWSKKVPCIFITHQLFINTGNAFSGRMAQKINYSYINKFAACWVPDAAGADNLAGKLSHPKHLTDVPVSYIGILSRFEKSIAEKSIDLLVMLSGPEPQRTMLEDIVLPQMEQMKGKVVLVRGLPQGGKKLDTKNTAAYDHLPAADLNALILSSKVVVARSGYSTVMDFAALQQRAILIATPGQGEQEYLSQYLSEKNYCFAAEQAGFDLKDNLEKLSQKKIVAVPFIFGRRIRDSTQAYAATNPLVFLLLLPMMLCASSS